MRFSVCIIFIITAGTDDTMALLFMLKSSDGIAGFIAVREDDIYSRGTLDQMFVKALFRHLLEKISSLRVSSESSHPSATKTFPTISL